MATSTALHLRPNRMPPFSARTVLSQWRQAWQQALGLVQCEQTRLHNHSAADAQHDEDTRHIESLEEEASIYRRCLDEACAEHTFSAPAESDIADQARFFRLAVALAKAYTESASGTGSIELVGGAAKFAPPVNGRHLRDVRQALRRAGDSHVRSAWPLF